MSAQRFELTHRECIERLRDHTAGRLCLIEHGYPLAIPISYVVSEDDSQIIVRTSPDTMLGRYEGLSSVEVDSIDLEIGSAWSVIARGTVHRVLGTVELPDPKPLLSERRTLWITLDIAAISGRRFEVHHAEDRFSVDWQLDPI
ncbi:MAG: pyridoxamine 5'-phosphate oxidase family protein [Ilumatobacteraceae bacterium]